MLACVAATIIGLLCLGLRDIQHGVALPAVSLLFSRTTLMIAGTVGYLLAIPAALIVIPGELLGFRSWTYYTVSGGLAPVVLASGFRADLGLVAGIAGLTFAIPVLFACGAMAGLVYWVVAGRSTRRS
jgi:hypothetical protein